MARAFLKDILESIRSTNLKIYNESFDNQSLVFECDVYVKPGSKKESITISNEGSLVVKTRARPIEGEANKSIIEMVTGFLNISKSNAEIIRGDKSKNKTIKILIEITASKNKKFYLEKITSISKDSA